MAPVFILLTMGILEFGYYLHQADTLEKSLRSGAMYAARSEMSGGAFTSTVATEIENIIKTGDKGGTGNFLLEGWSGCIGCLNIAVINRSVTENGTTVAVNVVQLRASVPYAPVIQGALDLIGFSSLMMRFQHEQVHFDS